MEHLEVLAALIHLSRTMAEQRLLRLVAVAAGPILTPDLAAVAAAVVVKINLEVRGLLFKVMMAVLVVGTTSVEQVVVEPEQQGQTQLVALVQPVA